MRWRRRLSICALTAAGLELDANLGQAHSFHETVGCKFFQAIAKLRALRKLGARTIEACGGDVSNVSSLRVVVETSRRVITHRDAWVNLLRNTAACFAGAVGGADAIITLPMMLRWAGDEVTRRLARNTQLILQEECHLVRSWTPPVDRGFSVAHGRNGRERLVAVPAGRRRGAE